MIEAAIEKGYCIYPTKDYEKDEVGYYLGGYIVAWDELYRIGYNVSWRRRDGTDIGIEEVDGLRKKYDDEWIKFRKNTTEQDKYDKFGMESQLQSQL